jgi:hypothetical protein
LIDNFKLLRGGIKQTIIHGDYTMRFEVMDNGLLFIEVKHSLGNVTTRMSDIVKLNYGFNYAVTHGNYLLNYYCGGDFSVGNVLTIIISLMKSV